AERCIERGGIRPRHPRNRQRRSWRSPRRLPVGIQHRCHCRRFAGASPDPHGIATAAVDLLRIPIFALSIATSIASFGAQMLAFVALPFYLESRFGYTAVQIGLFIKPWAIA